jgi:hypothetical protein
VNCRRRKRRRKRKRKRKRRRKTKRRSECVRRKIADLTHRPYPGRSPTGRPPRAARRRSRSRRG